MSGKDGVLSDEQSTGLHVQGRHTRQEWQDLEDEMKKLNIIEFEDPFLKQFGADLIHIEYVRNQIDAHGN